MWRSSFLAAFYAPLCISTPWSGPIKAVATQPQIVYGAQLIMLRRTKGGLWTQIVSNVIGREQLLPAETIGASYGDSLLAAVAGGLAEPATRWNAASVVIEPDPDTREVYSRLYDLYRQLYPTTQPIVHSLADMQTGNS